MKARTLAALAASSVLAVPTAAQADVFNGRIAFSSFRASPGELTGDIYSINHDGTDLRLLTTKNEKEDDAQSDWAPDGRDIAYRIRKPGSPINFEVSRMRADGSVPTRLTFSEVGEASSQPTWWPDRSRMLFRVSGPGVSSMWTMNTDGKNPALLFDPPRHQFYPSVSPDGKKLLFSSVEVGSTDRAIETMPVAGGEVTTLLDHPTRLRLRARLVTGRHQDRVRVERERARPQSGQRHGDLGHGRRRHQRAPDHPQRCA